MSWSNQSETKSERTYSNGETGINSDSSGNDEYVFPVAGKFFKCLRIVGFTISAWFLFFLIAGIYHVASRTPSSAVSDSYHAQTAEADRELRAKGIDPDAPAANSTPTKEQKVESISNDRFKDAKRVMGVKPYNAFGRSLVVDYLSQVQAGTTHYDEAQKILSKMPDDVKRYQESSDEYKIVERANELAKQKHYSEALQALSDIHKGMPEFKVAQVTRAEILDEEKSDEIDAQEANAPKLDNGSVTIACRDAIRPQARFPSKADFSIFKENIAQSGSTTRMVGEVELMNGIGNMIPAKFFCTFQGTTLTSAVLVQQ